MRVGLAIVKNVASKTRSYVIRVDAWGSQYSFVYGKISSFGNEISHLGNSSCFRGSLVVPLPHPRQF